MSAAMRAEWQEPLIPEDMLTKITSSPRRRYGSKKSAYCCGGICVVVTTLPAFISR